MYVCIRISLTDLRSQSHFNAKGTTKTFVYQFYNLQYMYIRTYVPAEHTTSRH